MPIYHFNVFNEAQGRSSDCIGTELPDAEVAGREALRLAGMMIAESASSVRYPEIWHVDVTDQDGTTLFNLDFAIRAALSRSAQHTPFTRELHRHGVEA